MPKAYVIVHYTFLDAKAFTSDYASKVEETIVASGGRFLVRATEIAYGEGDAGADLHVVVEFPSLDAALVWKSSDAYQAIEQARTNNATGPFIIIDGV
jgi:uncharacterized protein (DUF1330 family)